MRPSLSIQQLKLPPASSWPEMLPAARGARGIVDRRDALVAALDLTDA